MHTEVNQPEMVSWQDYESDLLRLCMAKADDFHLLGYGEVTAQEIWACVRQVTKGQVSLNEMVSKILGLQISQLMNYLTMNAYKGILDEPFKFDAVNRT